MSCKGKKGKEYTNCMRWYKKSAKNRFPSFNQEKDTIISTGGKSLGGISKKHQRKIKNSGGKAIKTKQFKLSSYAAYDYAKTSLVEKPKKKNK